jgi:UDP-N-acetyl-2-amino-2-deoxyglucuronate dehydrogenase
MYKFAIIGCGRIAHRHAENILRIGELVAVCDTEQKKADKFAAHYTSKAYYSIDDLLKKEKEVDVISVCTPNGLHAEHSIKSLQGGKHVLCEKPMCIAMEAAWSMMDTAHFFRRKLFIVKQNRFNPPVQFVKKLLEENKLGKIFSFQVNCLWNRPQEYYDGGWRGSGDLDGGLLYTQFSHFIDLLYWFLGDVEEVTGYKKNFGLRSNLNFEDSGIALLKMKNGSIGTINYTINSYKKNVEGSLALIGEKGSIKIGGQYLNTIEWQSLEEELHFDNHSTTNANDYGFYTGSMSNHDKVYDEFIKALDNAPNSLPKPAEALKTIEIIRKIYKASEEVR